jgi:RNA polymerase sigma-70 factor, ECF subfamily
MPAFEGVRDNKTNDDAEIVRRASNGDQDACRELYLRHKGRIFTLACRMTGNRTEAEDLTQEIFVQAFRGLYGFREASSFATWLYRIAINRCRSHLRKNGAAEMVEIDRVEIGTAGQQRQSDLRMLLEETVGLLPGGCREVFILHDVQGLAHDEIAEILGCTAGTVRSQLWKARSKLRDMIAPRLSSEDYGLSGLEQEAAEPAG